MDSGQAQSNITYPPNLPMKNSAFIFPLKSFIVAVIFLALGLGLGIFSGQMIKGSFKSDSKSVSNAVFTAQPSYFAPVEGTLVGKGENKITLGKNGSELEIEVPMTSPALIQDGSAGQIVTKTIADVELGSLLKGSVVVSPEFMAGDKNGKVTGSAFFVTKK